MSIDGATHMDEVGSPAWEKLAAEVGFASRFLEQRVLPFVERVTEAAEGLTEGSEHTEESVREIVNAIWWRGERFGLSA